MRLIPQKGLFMDTNKLYELWLEKATEDPDLKAELESVKGNEEEISDRFYRELEFGTGGLRGIVPCICMEKVSKHSFFQKGCCNKGKKYL